MSNFFSCQQAKLETQSSKVRLQLSSYFKFISIYYWSLFWYFTCDQPCEKEKVSSKMLSSSNKKEKLSSKMLPSGKKKHKDIKQTCLL
jgi:hypothetical protein